MPPITVQEAGSRLRHSCLATVVTLNRWGVTKPLTRQQKQSAASPFGARGTSLSASKKLINWRHPRYRAITQLCNQVRRYWESVTLPYVEKDKRLLRADREAEFDTMMATFGAELREHALKLQEVRGDLIAEARELLQDLFNEADYPALLDEQYSLVVEKPTIEPPAYLETINPQEYQRRLEQFQLQMQQTVLLAEQTLSEELAGLVHSLADRLGEGPDGRQRIFRDSSVDKLKEFFGRFRDLKVRDGSELDNIVRQAEELVSGHEPKDLRGIESLRSQVRDDMKEIERQLAPLITPRARRRLGIGIIKQEPQEKEAEVVAS